MLRLVFAITLLANTASADTLVAARTIRALSVLTAEDIAFGEKAVPGALSEPSQAIGLEARAVLYAGRPIRPGDLAPAAIVARNQQVMLNWQRGGLNIVAEGRSLDRAAPGEDVRAINLTSRTTVMGTVQTDGSVLVSGPARNAKGDF